MREAMFFPSLGATSGRCASPALFCTFLGVMQYATVFSNFVCIGCYVQGLPPARIFRLAGLMLHNGFHSKTSILVAMRKGCMHEFCIAVARCKGFKLIAILWICFCVLCANVLGDFHGFSCYLQGFQGYCKV
jgi:hypothetical protein